MTRLYIFATSKGMDKADALAFIGSQTWTFAKTAIRNPHEYIVRGKGNTPEQIRDFALHIFEHGKRRIWGGKIYVCWYPGDGWRYWTMGDDLDQTRLVNRAHDTADDTTAPAPFRQYAWQSPDGEMPEGLRMVLSKRLVKL